MTLFIVKDMLWCSLTELDLVVLWENEMYRLILKFGVGCFRELTKKIMSDISKMYINGSKLSFVSRVL